jgi:hypothetical protein
MKDRITTIESGYGMPADRNLGIHQKGRAPVAECHTAKRNPIEDEGNGAGGCTRRSHGRSQTEVDGERLRKRRGLGRNCQLSGNIAGIGDVEQDRYRRCAIEVEISYEDIGTPIAIEIRDQRRGGAGSRKIIFRRDELPIAHTVKDGHQVAVG